MVIIGDPDWYLQNQNTPDKIYTNAIFALVGIYYYPQDPLLGTLFLFLSIASTTFHIFTSRETLFLDRFSMVLIFSYFFNLFYPSISFSTFSILGILTVGYWYRTHELVYYFLFQLVGLVLFLLFYPLSFIRKLVITISYILLTYSQMLEKGKYHSLKQVGLGLLPFFIKI